MVDVDLIPAANVTYLVARQLIARGPAGTIVNMGSRGAFRGEPEFPAYGAAKAALHAFGQSMAVALAPHDIAVVSVAPGFVSYDRQAEKPAGLTGDAVRSESPFGRVGTPQEVAHAVLHLTPDGHQRHLGGAEVLVRRRVQQRVSGVVGEQPTSTPGESDNPNSRY